MTNSLHGIPLLVNEKLNILTTGQLRLLHYILGYDCNEIATELLVEEFEGHSYEEIIAKEISNILKRDNILVMEKPY